MVGTTVTIGAKIMPSPYAALKVVSLWKRTRPCEAVASQPSRSKIISFGVQRKRETEKQSDASRQEGRQAGRQAEPETETGRETKRMKWKQTRSRSHKKVMPGRRSLWDFQMQHVRIDGQSCQCWTQGRGMLVEVDCMHTAEGAFYQRSGGRVSCGFNVPILSRKHLFRCT